MKINISKNIILENNNGRFFSADLFMPKSDLPVPLLIFIHGYKGYKDWGAWSLMAEKITKSNMAVVTFNFSYNGTTIENPSEFKDLEAFGKNTYSQELKDLEMVVEYFSKLPLVNPNKISLMAHSRGGAIATIYTATHQNIYKLILLASVSTLDRFPKGEKLEEWESQGIYYTYNSRTKQKMPHFFSFYLDYKTNEEKLNVQKAAEIINTKTLIIHGSKDEAVDIKHAENLNTWIQDSTIMVIENANHTFGAKEPWIDYKMPILLRKATIASIDFLNA